MKNPQTEAECWLQKRIRNCLADLEVHMKQLPYSEGQCYLKAHEKLRAASLEFAVALTDADDIRALKEE